MDNENIPTGNGATQIFRMPSADATVPDIMAVSKPVQPTLTIVKGPQIGERLSSTRRPSPLGAIRATAFS